MLKRNPCFLQFIYKMKIICSEDKQKGEALKSLAA